MIRELLPLLEILAYLYCFAATFGKKMNYNIYGVIFIISEMILMIGINDYGFPKYLISLSYVLMVIYCSLNYKDTILRALLNVGISFVIIGIAQLVIYFVLATVFKDNNIGNILWEFYTMLLCFIFSRVLSSRIKLKELSDFLYGRKLLLIFVSAFVLIVFGSQVWKIKRDANIDGKDVVYVVYFFSLLIFLIYEWQRTRSDVEKRKLQLEMNAMYYSAYEDLIRSVREKQHDFKNHMNALRGMLYSIEDYEKLVQCESEYLRDILNETEETSILTMVENPLLAGFLSEKIHEAERHNIEVIHHCSLRNQNLIIPEYKLVEIMGILIDNAIEAVEQEAYDKLIQLNLNEDNGTMIFETINECEEDKFIDISKLFKQGYSSKGENRGIGLSKLKHMLDEEHGEIFISREEMRGRVGICFRIEIPIH